MNHKYILATAGILMLAAGCNNSSQTVIPTPAPVTQNQPAQNSEQPDYTPPADTTAQPENQPSAQQIFIDKTKKISLDYTGLSMQTKTPASYIPAQNSLVAGTSNLFTLYLNPAIYKGTNLESAWFNLAVSSQTDKTTCYDNALAGNNYDQIRNVQGNSWHYALPNPKGSAAAGHSALTETYRLYKNSMCYEVALGLSATNRQNLANPNSVKEYDAKKMANYLGAVFNKLQVQ